MKSITLLKKLKAVLSEKKLNKLGLQIGFAKRLRNIRPFQLIVSFIGAWEIKKHDTFLKFIVSLTSWCIKMFTINRSIINWLNQSLPH